LHSLKEICDSWNEEQKGRENSSSYENNPGALCKEVDFVGFAEWTQDTRSQTDEDQDRLMNEACNSLYAGTRAATAEEFKFHRIINLPQYNLSGKCCVFTIPGNTGIVNAHALSGHSLLGVRKNKSFNGTFSTNNLYSSVRTCVCVRERPTAGVLKNSSSNNRNST